LILSPYNAPTRVVNGRVICEPKRKKVAIVAFSQTGIAARDFHNLPDWEIWGLNHGYALKLFWDDEGRFRCDRHWEMHPVRVQPTNDLRWMSVCPIPIYVLDLNDTHPQGYSENAVQFPRAECEALFPMAAPGFWACTFSYQIALAIIEGFEEIALLGFDFATPREWLFERPNVLFWAGYAAGMGIKLTWPKESTLFEHPFAYGYDYEGEIAWCKQGVNWWTQAWGYELTQDGKAFYADQDRRTQEAIAR
jgi:hypothetical protein